jgi:hypothetical protein
MVEERPKNLSANTLPTDGYGVEVDGKIKSHHITSEAAFKAGSDIKRHFPVVQVKILDAANHTQTQVETPTEPAEMDVESPTDPEKKKERTTVAPRRKTI